MSNVKQEREIAIDHLKEAIQALHRLTSFDCEDRSEWKKSYILDIMAKETELINVLNFLED